MDDQTDSPLRLICDRAALQSNWRALDAMSGASTGTGAAVKANAYGLGVGDVVPLLHHAGCRDFFVASWEEAVEIRSLTGSATITVLNGILPGQIGCAKASGAKPMLNSPEQITQWRDTGLPCDIMINSGMNRLGIDPGEVSAIDWSGLNIDILASHMASADEDCVQNADQLAAYRDVLGKVPHRRTSLANSAAIGLGPDYAFDLTRPGLSLYGGIPRSVMADHIKPVARIEAQILQRRNIPAGSAVGYNATYIAPRDHPVAIISIGYADGYLRGFSGTGCFYADGAALPVIGRVSMDLVALDISAMPSLGEGDWVILPLDLPLLSEQSGLSQYEILTSLGSRFDRYWTD